MKVTIRGGTETVSLASTATSGYIIQSWELGVPKLEQVETGPSSFSDALRKEAVDSFELAVTGTNREVVRALVEKLHLVLRQAMDYWVGAYNYPVFVEARPHDATKPMYATIKSFEFHEMPDPSDTVNKTVQGLTLVITRRMWSSIPPQPVPHLFINQRREIMTEAQIAENHLRPRLLPLSTGPLHHDRDLTVITPDDSNDSMVFLANGYRFGSINNILQPGSATNRQPTAYSSPYGLGWGNTSPNILLGNQGRYAVPILGLAMNIGTKAIGVNQLDVYQGRTGGTFHKLFGPDALKHNAYTLYTGAAYIGTSPRTMYGDTVLQSRLNQPPTKSTLYDAGYWVKLSASGVVTQLPLQSNNLLYSPWSPYIDVAAKGGSLDMPLRLAIKFLSRWNEEPTSTEQYVANRRYATDVVIASSHSTVDTNDIDLHEPGFYNFRDLNELTEDEPNLYTMVHGATGKMLADDEAPGGMSYRVDLGDLYSKSYSSAHGYGGFFVSLASLVYRGWNAGTYRVFLRYRTDITIPTTGYPQNFSLRLAVAPFSSEGEFLNRANYSRVHTHIHPIEGTYSSTSKYNSLINVADFGVIKIPSEGGIRQLNAITVEGATNYNAWSTPSNIKDYLHLIDLIVLPVNENFMHFTGSKTGKAPYSTNGGDIWERNAETLYIDGWAPKGTAAYMVDEVSAAITSSYGKVPKSLSGTANNPWTRLTTGEAMIKPYGRTRLYFFWFKRAANGVLLSDPALVTTVKAWGMDQRISIPSLAPEVKYVERPLLPPTDPGDDLNLPVASISASATSGTTATTFTFTDNSTVNGGISRIVWGIDGKEFVGEIGGDIEHIFEEAGTFEIVLVVYGRNGLVASTDVIEVTVSLAAQPRPNFTWSPIDPDEDELITFKNTSQNETGITKWIWNWGDGSSPTEAVNGNDQTHTFDEPGKYFVTLELTNASGTLYGKVLGIVNVASTAVVPTMDFSYSQLPSNKKRFEFVDDSSNTAGVNGFAWDWGDGTQDVYPSLAPPADIFHTFPADGTYDVTLTFFGENAVVLGQVTKEVEVDSTVTPVASFSYLPASPESGDDVTFTDESTDTGDVTNWIWEVYYDDQIVSQVLSEGLDVVFNFPSAGTYDVILHLYGAGGFLSSDSQEIVVVDP